MLASVPVLVPRLAQVWVLELVSVSVSVLVPRLAWELVLELESVCLKPT